MKYEVKHWNSGDITRPTVGSNRCPSGINLLREGLIYPVSLIAILDADREGFLRSETALVKIIGRAARNVNGKVIMYANNMTDSMQRAISETNRRRSVQVAYNEKHGITPETVRKAVHESLRAAVVEEKPVKQDALTKQLASMSSTQIADLIKQLEEQMFAAAKDLDFEKAAEFRDEVSDLRKILLEGMNT